MSREVRRVPVGWKHPLEYNPRWEFQASTPYGRTRPASRLHGPTEQFVPLLDDFAGRLSDWESELVAIYGEARPVAPLAPVDHTSIDPIAEIKMMRPDLPIIEFPAKGVEW
jgi:hypothetical protein